MYKKILPILRQRHKITVNTLWRIAIASFLIVLLLSILLFYVALLCGDFLTRDIRSDACEAYADQIYSEPYCEELCSGKDTLQNVKCVYESPHAVTAERNGHLIAIHYPDEPSKSLSWRSSGLTLDYPKKSEFYNILKLHLLINYNVTLKDKKSIFPYTEAIDENKYKEMEAYWMLFNWNDYVMFKLFEDEEIFPKILGNCGPFFISERLTVRENNRNYEALKKRRYFVKFLEYVLRLEAMKPDPLKICNMKLNNFGLTKDLRLKAHNAKFIKLESQLNKQLANGDDCTTDEDCKWHDCLGVCDQEKRICNAAQKNNNLKLLCDYVRVHPTAFPELLAKPLQIDWQLYAQHCWQWNGTKAEDFANRANGRSGNVVEKSSSFS
ncbi:protein FAM69C [Ceratitis capitata]|uniref:protein FAM69C n=1 Tax=Ceratitis capitata TaxID=7213 RepID=UPI0006187E91|nr:protein FAM69C [Ceratitis capitata]